MEIQFTIRVGGSTRNAAQLKVPAQQNKPGGQRPGVEQQHHIGEDPAKAGEPQAGGGGGDEAGPGGGGPGSGTVFVIGPIVICGGGDEAGPGGGGGDEAGPGGGGNGKQEIR